MTTSSSFRITKELLFRRLECLTACVLVMLTDLGGAAVPIAPGELVAPKIEIVGGTLNLTVQPSVAGRSYQLQHSDALEGGTWLSLGEAVIGDGNNLVMTTPYAPGVSRRFFRLALDGSPVAPDGFALIPAGSFQMGQDGIATPVRTVNVSGVFMAKYETTKELWTEVRAWGRTAGYTDIAPGLSKAVGHPVEWVTWYDVVKWCNARSENHLSLHGLRHRRGEAAALLDRPCLRCEGECSL